MNGTITLKNGEKVSLEDLYNEYNQLYFDGKLRKCHLYTYNGKTSVGLYLGKRRKNNGYLYKLSVGIARNIDWTIEDLRNVLVHEMVHVYLNCQKNPPKRPHGKEFKAFCRSLEAKYGLDLPRKFKHLDFNNIVKPKNPLGYIIYWIKQYIL